MSKHRIYDDEHIPTDEIHTKHFMEELDRLRKRCSELLASKDDSIQSLNSALRDAHGQVSDSKEDVIQLENEIKHLKQQLDDKNGVIKKLKTDLQSQEQNVMDSAVENQLKQESIKELVQMVVVTLDKYGKLVQDITDDPQHAADIIQQKHHKVLGLLAVQSITHSHEFAIAFHQVFEEAQLKFQKGNGKHEDIRSKYKFFESCYK